MKSNNLKAKAKNIPVTAIVAFLVLIGFSIFAKGFLSLYSLSVILKNTSILSVAAFGMTIAIISGKIDASIGSTMSLSAVIAGLCLSNGLPLPIAIVAGLLTGAFIGFFNGFCIAVLKFNYWLTTFAMLGIAKGLALGLTNGITLAKLNDGFKELGNGSFLHIYYITWVALAVSILIFFITKRTRYGYRLYSVGDSEECSRLSGINVEKVYITNYVISGVMAAIAGILLASKANAANPIIGDPYTFDSIAAVIIGGTPFAGGKGSVLGSILGAFILTSLRHGLALLGLSSLYQIAIIGFVIMIVIIVDVMHENRVEENEKRRVYTNEV